MMTGVDLSPALRAEPLPNRPFAYGGYSDSHYVRDEQFAYMADNRRARAGLFDLNHDPGELHNVAGQHPGLVRSLYATVRDRAGGPPPWYDA